MIKLTDIAPAFEKIDLRGKEAEVRAISASTIVSLAFRFPAIRDLMAGGAADTSAILSLAEDAVAAILAAALGHAGEEDWEKALRDLPMGEQVDILEATVRLTMPRGLGPFVERLRTLISSAGIGESVPAEDRK